jgi:hypothetical protein
MTTAVVQAFEKAGVQVSVKRRLWAWLLDNPNRSTKEIAGALGVSVDNVGVELRGMVARGMLEASTDPRTVAGRHGRRVTRNIIVYTVPPSMRQQYELLPVQKKGAPVARKTAKTVTVTVHPTAVTALDNRPVFSPSTFTEGLTLKEAKAVFDYLGRMFK